MPQSVFVPSLREAQNFCACDMSTCDELCEFEISQAYQYNTRTTTSLPTLISNPRSPLLEPQPGISRMINHFLSQNTSATTVYHTTYQTDQPTMSTVTLATTCGLYRNYDTRSNSTPQSTHPMKPTGHIRNSNMILKSLTPDLQLDKTECATVPKTSSTPIQEAHKDNLKQSIYRPLQPLFLRIRCDKHISTGQILNKFP